MPCSLPFLFDLFNTLDNLCNSLLVKRVEFRSTLGTRIVPV